MPFDRWRKVGWVIFISLVLMVSLSACNPTNSQPADAGAGSDAGGEVVSQSPAQEEADPAPKGLESESDTSQPTPLVTPTQELPPTAVPDAEEMAPEPTQTEEAAPPEKVFVASDRPLAGTDPSSVNLANGQYQFVEFFAHW